MSSKNLLALVCTISLVFVLVRTPNFFISAPMVIIVPDDYPTIQQAINALVPERTVFVRNGTYHENVVITKSLLLQGESLAGTIIDGGGIDDVVTIASGGVNITGFTVKNAAWWYDGIHVIGGGSCRITGNRIMDCEYGVVLEASELCTVESNELTNNIYGGLLLRFSTNNYVHNNTFVKDGLLVLYSNNNTVEGNTVNGKPLVYLEGVVGGKATGFAGQIVLVGCTGVLVYGFALANTTVGIELAETNNTTVFANLLEDCQYGVILVQAQNCSVNGNTMRRCVYGMETILSPECNFVGNLAEKGVFGVYNYFSDQFNVYLNRFLNNTGMGVYMTGAFNCGVAENNILENAEKGVEFDFVSNSQISENNLTANGDYGAYIQFGSGNTVGGNWVSGSNTGVELTGTLENTVLLNTIVENYDGISLNSSASNNLISGNNATANDRWGIVIYGNNNVVTGNAAMANGYEGIGVEYSTNNTIVGNEATANLVTGISLDWASNNTVSKNKATMNLYGIGVYAYSNNNLISGNNATANTSWGIDLWLCSNNNTVIGNQATANSIGICILSSSNNTVTENNITNNWYGMNLYLASGNLMYHNGFVNNTQHVSNDGSPNIWDDGYPSGGNYWDTHVDVDLYYGEFQDLPGSDGILDHSRILDESNVDHYPLTSLWSLDETPPTIILSSPENKTYSTVNVPLTFAISEGAPWIGYSLDRAFNVTISGNLTLSVSEGAHNITVYASDVGGNVGKSNTIYFTVDTIPPEIDFVSPEPKDYCSDQIQINFTVNEPTLWMCFSVDDGANVTYTGEVTLTLSEGGHKVTVYAQDAAGNVASTFVKFIVDLTAPNIVTVTQTPETVQVDDKVYVNATVTDVLGRLKRVVLTYVVDGTEYPTDMAWLENNVYTAVIPPFPYGTNVTYIITAEDYAGNLATSELSYYLSYVVVPEFPSAALATIFMLTTLLSVLLYKKRAKTE